MDLTGFREKYPDYNDIPDEVLIPKIQTLHAKDYSDMPFEDFAGRVGIGLASQPSPTGPTPSMGMPGMEAAYPDMPAVPQREVSGGAVEQIPLIAAMAGGSAGGIPGAAVGGFLGDLTAQGIEKIWDLDLPDPDLERAVKTGLIMGAGEGTGKVVGGILGAGAKKSMATAKNIIKYVKEYDLPISPSEYIKGGMAKSAQWLSEYFPLGQAWMIHKRRQLVDGLIDVTRNELVKWADEPLDVDVVGEMLKGQLGPAKAASRKAVSEAYDEIKNVIKLHGNNKIRVSETFDASDEVMSWIKEVDPNLSKYKSLYNHLAEFSGSAQKTKGQLIVDAEKFHWFQSGLWETLPAKETTGSLVSKKVGAGIWEAIKRDASLFSEDLAGGVDLVKTMEAAKEASTINRWFTKHVATINRKVAQGQTINAVRLAVQGGDAESIAYLKDTIMKTEGGEEVWDAVSKRYLQNIIDTSIQETPEGTRFVPGQLIKKFDEQKSRIFKVFGEEVYDQWSDWVAVLRVAQKDVSAAQGSIMNAVVKGSVGAAGSGGATLVPGAQVTIPVMNGMSWMIAKSMMNPKGWVRGYLSTGIPGAELVGEAVGTTAKAALLEMQNRKQRDRTKKNIPAELLRP